MFFLFIFFFFYFSISLGIDNRFNKYSVTLTSDRLQANGIQLLIEHLNKYYTFELTFWFGEFDLVFGDINKMDNIEYWGNDDKIK